MAVIPGRSRARFRTIAAMSGAQPPRADGPTDRREQTRQAREAWCRARSVLFVCLGNVCRSPFAERLAARELGPDRRVTSAGHYPVAGRRVPAPAVTAAQDFGVDLRSHRSRILSRELLSQADVVFVFDGENYRAVLSEDPEALGRVHRLAVLADDGPLGIPDPFGGPLSEYERVYRRIADAIAAAERARRGPSEGRP